MLFVAVNSSDKKQSTFNNDKQIVRYEFLEIMIRVAIKRYFESGKVQTEADAVQKLWDDHLKPHKELTDQIDPYFYNL